MKWEAQLDNHVSGSRSKVENFVAPRKLKVQEFLYVATHLLAAI